MMRLTTVMPVPWGTICYVICTPFFSAEVTHLRSPIVFSLHRRPLRPPRNSSRAIA